MRDFTDMTENTFGKGFFFLGKTKGQNVYGDPAKMRNIFIGAGRAEDKNALLNQIILSLLSQNSSRELRLLICDDGALSAYDGLPHLFTRAGIWDRGLLRDALCRAIAEMEHRYELILQDEKLGLPVRDFEEYGRFGAEKLPLFLIIMNNASRFISGDEEMWDIFRRLLQKSGAAGIHFIFAEEIPLRHALPDEFLSYFFTRIACGMDRRADSMRILGEGGAERLGSGEFLLCRQYGKMQKVTMEPVTREEIQEGVRAAAQKDGCGKEDGTEEGGPLYIRALALVIRNNDPTAEFLERTCGVSRDRAERIIGWMQSMGYLSPAESRPQQILLSWKEFLERYGS